MKRAIAGTTDEELDAILERRRLDPSPDPPIALEAAYDSRLDLVVLTLDNGERLTIPREQLEGLENATPEQLSNIKIFAGVDIAWMDLDVDHYLPYLLEGKYASERWKQARKQQQVVAA